MKLYGQLETSEPSNLEACTLLLGQTPKAPLFTAELTGPQGEFFFQKLTASALPFPLSLYVLIEGTPVVEHTFADKAALNAVLVAETKSAEANRLVILQLPARAPVVKGAQRTQVTTAMEPASASRATLEASEQTRQVTAAMPKQVVEFISIQGAVESSAGPVTGYTLEVSCPDTIAGDSEVTPIHQERLLGPTGAFQLDFAVTGRFSTSPLTFVVRTPNGLPTRLISPMHLTVSQAAKLAVVKVQVEPFSPIVLVPGSSATPATRVLKGRLVDPTGRALKRQQILFQALRGDGTSPPLKISLAAVTTHSSGNFSVVVPNEPFLAAHAVVSSRPEDELPIALNADGTFPAFTLLVVETGTAAEDGGGEDDCACHDPTPRLPGTEELVANASSYSQDIGGSCVNFTVPNRTLEEFSHYAIVRTTDPRGQLVPIREAPAWEWNGDTSDPVGYARHLHRTLRQTLGTKNPLRWDDDANDYELYQAVSLAHGHVLHFKQTFKADGYSMGDLLYSLPLAPGQKKQLAIYDWNREDGASRDEATVVEEGLTHSLSRDRDIDEILSGTVQESMRGGSSAKTRGFSFGLGGAGSGSKNGVAVGLSTGFSISGGSGTSSAWQDNTRDMTSSLHNRLRDATMQATSSVRSQRATVVTSAKQGESLSVQTEVVANHNHCHALTIQYFEILRHFVIEQQVVDVQECLFVPLMMSLFTDAKILRWRECLSEHLLYSGDTTRGQELRRGFDALERIARNYQGTDFPRRVEPSGAVTFLPFSEESIEEFSGELQLRLTLSRPADQPDGTIDAAAWATLSHIFLGLDIHGIRNLFLKLSIEERERAFQTQHAPALARNFVEQLRFEAILANGTTVKDLRLDCTLLTDYAPGRPLTVSVRSTRTTDMKALKAGVAQQPFSGTPADLKRNQIVGLRLSAPSVSLSGSFAVLDRGTLRYRTPHFSGTLVNDQAIRNDIGFADQIYLPTPMKPEEQRNPWQEDQRLAQQLRDHLNQENLEYYHHTIWCHGITPHRRYMMLDRIHLAQDDFNSIYAQRGVLGRSLASLVENRLLGVAGNSLVFPVARGLNLDPTYEMGTPDQSGSGAIAHASLLEHYQTEAEREGGQGSVFRLSVPTPGVFAEAVRGACNACERIDDTRFWRWEQSPTDEPTAINPVSTDSRYQTPQSTTPTSLPQPIVNIQNAPAAPDPTGVGSLLTALGQVSPFANLTGLDQNQKNALAAMTSNQETARAFGEMATKLAMSAQSSRNSAVLNEQIDKAFPVARAPAKNQEWKERLLNAQLGGESVASGSKASPLDQLDLRETIDAVRGSPGMEVDVGPSQVAVRNRSGARRGSSATSAPEVSDEQPPATEWPFIEGYSQITALYPRLTQILESSSVFRQSVIEPFSGPSAAVPLIIEAHPTAPNGFDGQCIIEVRDPSDTTTPGGTWISLLQLTRDLAGFDMARDVRIRVLIAMRGQATSHPGGMLLIISHEWALHALGCRETILRARSEAWTLKALRDFYVAEVSSHQHHRQIGSSTNATYEAVNDDLERLLNEVTPLLTVRIKRSYIDGQSQLLPLPTRAVAPLPSRIYNLNHQHSLYTAYQMFVFEREMEKSYKYNPAHPMNYLQEGTSADAWPWDYLDSNQTQRPVEP
ncbi:hypothetical protein G4177_33875 [Corallococcus sp. ZKHCc1 1396]|uniref:Uncharacterized protein n=1 Tax=Corallococcus soli TaxID=2710757 RepID=A0ABR9PZ09_9BACT|nr:hypothetical protein [Corallococcus soli]